MKILIDTSAYSEFRRASAAVVKAISRADVLLVSPIVLGELLFGFRKGGRYAQNMKLLEEFLRHEAVEVVPVGEVTADRYSRIVLQLKDDGTPIPANDVWIAAQAMEHGADLLTFDAHFGKVKGLACVVPQ
jgi:tRNA(fMet)-specific endonuclease VapC